MLDNKVGVSCNLITDAIVTSEIRWLLDEKVVVSCALITKAIVTLGIR